MSTRLDQLRALLADEPRDNFLRYAIALELKRLDRHVEALADLEVLVRDEPKHIPTYYQLAIMLAEAGRTKDAIEACEAGALQCIVTGDRKTRAELIGLKETFEEDQA